MQGNSGAPGWHAQGRDLRPETLDLRIPARRCDTFIGLRPCFEPPGSVAIF
jgi:hypothetical protein